MNKSLNNWSLLGFIGAMLFTGCSNVQHENSMSSKKQTPPKSNEEVHSITNEKVLQLIQPAEGFEKSAVPPRQNFSYNIQELNLSSSTLNARAIKLLSQMHLPKLTSLDLSRNNFGTEGISHLVKSEYSSLKYLGLQFVVVNTTGLNFLSKLESGVKWELEVREPNTKTLKEALDRFKRSKNLIKVIFYMGAGKFYK